MKKLDKVVGVIGGMGPDATVDFMSRVLDETPASEDQDHVRMVVECNPRVPSRQQAIRGEGESPGPELAAMAQRLEAAGADFLVMPCNLAHAWQSEIITVTTVPFVSIIDEAVAAAIDHSGPDSAIGVMTTPGCFFANLYQGALSDTGRPVVVQTPGELAETMSLVARIKAGDKSNEVRDALAQLGRNLIVRGARVLIAACTEFSLVFKESMFDVALVSSTEVLAKRTVAIALNDAPFRNGPG